jgi:hypothetical protein
MLSGSCWCSASQHPVQQSLPGCLSRDIPFQKYQIGRGVDTLCGPNSCTFPHPFLPPQPHSPHRLPPPPTTTSYSPSESGSAVRQGLCRVGTGGCLVDPLCHAASLAWCLISPLFKTCRYRTGPFQWAVAAVVRISVAVANSRPCRFMLTASGPLKGAAATAQLIWCHRVCTHQQVHSKALCILTSTATHEINTKTRTECRCRAQIISLAHSTKQSLLTGWSTELHLETHPAFNIFQHIAEAVTTL